MDSMKTIQSIEIPRFQIKLVQNKAGRYFVAYQTITMDKPVVSEAMVDFRIAKHVFEVQLQELEGN